MLNISSSEKDRRLEKGKKLKEEKKKNANIEKQEIGYCDSNSDVSFVGVHDNLAYC